MGVDQAVSDWLPIEGLPMTRPGLYLAFDYIREADSLL
jgi:hypothetical protein